MKFKKAKKVIARPAQVNSNQQPSANTGVRTAVAVTRPTFIGIKDVQRLYLPMLSLKKIRKIVTLHVHTIKVGNKFLVSKDQLERLLSNPDIKIL
ncbi:MAG: hypothetical protein U0L79_07915 [Lachnospiraceae bacterium]|nr:hypothetical protein [Lachnospiraceae bacterium]